MKYESCETCHLIYSGRCQKCPMHIAELAEYKRKIEGKVECMAQEIWHPRNQPLQSLQEVKYDTTKDKVSRKEHDITAARTGKNKGKDRNILSSPILDLVEGNLSRSSRDKPVARALNLLNRVIISESPQALAYPFYQNAGTDLKLLLGATRKILSVPATPNQEPGALVAPRTPASYSKITVMAFPNGSEMHSQRCFRHEDAGIGITYPRSVGICSQLLIEMLR